MFNYPVSPIFKERLNSLFPFEPQWKWLEEVHKERNSDRSLDSDDLVREVEVSGFNNENLNVEYTTNRVGETIINIHGENDDGRKMRKTITLPFRDAQVKRASVKDGLLTIEFEKPERSGGKIPIEKG